VMRKLDGEPIDSATGMDFLLTLEIVCNEVSTWDYEALVTDKLLVDGRFSDISFVTTFLSCPLIKHVGCVAKAYYNA